MKCIDAPPVKTILICKSLVLSIGTLQESDNSSETSHQAGATNPSVHGTSSTAVVDRSAGRCSSVADSAVGASVARTRGNSSVAVSVASRGSLSNEGALSSSRNAGNSSRRASDHGDDGGSGLSDVRRSRGGVEVPARHRGVSLRDEGVPVEAAAGAGVLSGSRRLSLSGGGGRRSGRSLETGEVGGRVACGARVGCAARDSGLGGSTSATAVEDLADFASARNVPGDGSAGRRRDVGAGAALQIGAGEGSSGEGGRSQDGVGGSAHSDLLLWACCLFVVVKI